MSKNTMGKYFLYELKSEEESTRKCLERFPMDLYKWKPHEKSMIMGNLAGVVADIPKWISLMIESDEIDFSKYDGFTPKSTDDLVAFFDANIERAEKLLQTVSDSDLEKPFYLKNKGKVLMTSSKKDSIMSAINHLAHHRGQLTVYLRLNNIPVPSIYGPSADENVFMTDAEQK